MEHVPPPSARIPPGALPRSAAETLDWLRLIRSSRVGPATFLRLIAEHGGAPAALGALPRIAAAAGARGYAPCTRAAAEAEWAAAEAAGARALLLGGPGYPPWLALLPDPPPLLWAIGAPGIASASPVALVGARNASALGCRMARRLARELGAMGHAVVSGLARGIDAAAHEAALPTGTVAVLAGGVDVVYPPENAALAAAIAERGLRLSEMPMGEPPRASHFLRRNRLVSGLSRAVVVVEAAERSGALNTARHALDQGREVLAVPGHPLDPRAGGCNLLIRDGATLVRSAEDVTESLGPSHAPPRRAAAAAAPEGPVAEGPVAEGPVAEGPVAEGPVAEGPAPDGPVPEGPVAEGPVAEEAVAEWTRGEKTRGQNTPGEGPSREGRMPEAGGLPARLLALVGPVPVGEDALIRESGAPAPAVAAALLELELDGSVLRHPGGLVSRAGKAAASG